MDGWMDESVGGGKKKAGGGETQLIKFCRALTLSQTGEGFLEDEDSPPPFTEASFDSWVFKNGGKER